MQAQVSSEGTHPVVPFLPVQSPLRSRAILTLLKNDRPTEFGRAIIAERKPPDPSISTATP